MKDAARMILVLVALGAIAGAMLTAVYNYTNPLIEENRRKEMMEAITGEALPDAVDYKTIVVDGVTLYEGIDERGKVVGYAFEGEGNGYQGKIRIIAGLDVDLRRLKGIEILESSETPGLGANIAKEPFKSQFRGLCVLPEITFTKDTASKDNEIEAVTGATISTKSVVGILNEQISRVRAALKKR